MAPQTGTKATALKMRIGVFREVRTDSCACINRLCHATAKQKLHCNRGTVLSTRFTPRCYKQNRLGVAGSE
jgi:hypothetical protein